MPRAQALTFVINIEISVMCTYVQLCSEDYNWWWPSFYRGGSVALYVALYSIGFLSSTLKSLTGFLPVSLHSYVGEQGVHAVGRMGARTGYATAARVHLNHCHITSSPSSDPCVLQLHVHLHLRLVLCHGRRRLPVKRRVRVCDHARRQGRMSFTSLFA